MTAPRARASRGRGSSIETATIQGSARRDPSAWTALFGRSAPLTRLFPKQPLEPARDARRAPCEDSAPYRSTGSPAPASSRAGPRGKRSGSSTSGSSCSGRTPTGVAASGRLGWRVYYVPSASGIHFVGVEPRPPPAGLDPRLPRERLPLLPEAPGAARCSIRSRSWSGPGCWRAWRSGPSRRCPGAAAAASGRQCHRRRTRHEGIELGTDEGNGALLAGSEDRRQARLTETIRERPGSSMVTPYSTSAASMVFRLCVITMN